MQLQLLADEGGSFPVPLCFRSPCAGATAISALLQSRGVQLELLVDEGGLVVADGIKVQGFALVKSPLALVGTAEKVGGAHVVWF